jgi:hypothetical protein
MVPLYSIKSIIVHPGLAHRDDILSVAVALAIEGKCSVVRRLPTDEELNSPFFLVLDVGERHEPELNNFDHHQIQDDGNTEPECAFSLYVQSRRLDKVFELQRWYMPTILLDSLGPHYTARAIGISRFPFELIDPFGLALTQAFGSFHGEVSEEMVDILRFLGKQILESANKFAEQLAHLNRVCDVLRVDGETVLHLKTSDITASQEFRNRNHPNAVASISWDNRGSGWSLYRFGNNNRIDFTKISGTPGVIFTHRDGSLAKTQFRLPLEEVLDLVSKSFNAHTSLT